MMPRLVVCVVASSFQSPCNPHGSGREGNSLHLLPTCAKPEGGEQKVNIGAGPKQDVICLSPVLLPD